MRDVVDICAQRSPSTSEDPGEEENRNKSIPFPRQFWTGNATRRRICSRALRAFLRVGLSPSIYVDSASRGNLTLAVLKDAARLAAYFAATILFGAVIAPVLFWAGQWMIGHGFFPFLAKVDFETFFHRAILVAAAALVWPLLYLTDTRSMADLQLTPNSRWVRDLFAGSLFSVIPLLCCGILFIAFHIYSLRHSFAWIAFGKTVAASIAVPVIEETFFRGVVLGVLLRTGRQYVSIFVTSAIFSVIHFLKAPAQVSAITTWTSGFNSIAHSFWQFGDPTMLISAFATLFLIGWILAD